MQYFVDVILPLPLDKLFTYSITEAEAVFLKSGMRVTVPFGKSKIYTALVDKVHHKAPIVYEAKEIHEIIDEQPIVTSIQLQHFKWIANYYLCSIGEVYKAALPGILLLESETIIIKNDIEINNDVILTDDEFLVYEALQHQPILKVKEIKAILGKKQVLPILKGLLEKKVILVKEEVYEKYTPKLIKYIKLNNTYSNQSALQELLEKLSRAPKQREVILSLFTLTSKTKKPIKVKELETRCSTSASVIKSLVDKNILEEFYFQTDRLNYSGIETGQTKVLTQQQKEALYKIQNIFLEKNVVLLHGITASGKTEIYVKLIEEQLQKGKQVLLLLPEIALATQQTFRLQQYFGEKASIYHSKYTQNERVEIWNHVLNKNFKAQLVIGSRSALLLPFSNLGLIVVDEEHEIAYKRHDPAPRYHTRDAAIMLAHYHKAKTLLGSATPSIETFYNVQNQKYGYVPLEQRYGNTLMPEIELIDIKEKMRRKLMKGHFSDRLIEIMQETLQQGEQVLLFQNRRGYAPVIECNVCGHTPQCTNCDVSLTYYQHKKQLRCHYCGYNTALPSVCWACHNHTLSSKGFGTEQIEAELKEFFPNYTIGRMDADTTRGKHSFEKIITAFEQQEIDILVGTQMVAKGLDFKNVSLVGVMNADSLLNFPDYRAHEQTYQLLRQVAGRAGRLDKRGKVLIQTYNPYHQILQQVAADNYFEMYREQLEERIQYKYPPINKLIKITFKDKNFNTLTVAANWFSDSLRNNISLEVLGPEAPPIGRIRNLYIKNILVKTPKEESFNTTKQITAKIYKSFTAIAKFKSVKNSFSYRSYIKNYFF